MKSFELKKFRQSFRRFGFYCFSKGHYSQSGEGKQPHLTVLCRSDKNAQWRSSVGRLGYFSLFAYFQVPESDAPFQNGAKTLHFF